MANEVRTTFTGDAAPLFRTADQVEARLKQLESRAKQVFSGTGPAAPPTAASVFTQPVNPQHTRTVSDQLDMGLKRAIDARIQTFNDQLARQAQSNPIPPIFRPPTPPVPTTAAGIPAAPSAASSASVGVSTAAASAAAAGAVPPEAAQALTVLQAIPPAAGVATASIAALGAAAVYASFEIKRLADERLAIEERLTAEHNKQILSLQRSISAYELRVEKAKQAQAAERQLAENINQGNARAILDTQRRADEEARTNLAEAERLRGQLRVNQQLLENDKRRSGSVLSVFGFGESSLTIERRIRATTELIDDLNRRIAESESRAREAEGIVIGTPGALQRLTQNADAAFAARFEARKRSEQDAARFALEQARKFAESQEQGRKKVEELGKTWRETMTQIAGQTNSDNPFVRIFLDSQKAIDDLKEKLKGLPQDMQAAALASQREFNANQLFGARADNVLGSLDLRDLAARFRDDSAQRRAFGQAGINLSIADLNRTGGLAGRNAEAIIENLQRRQRLIDSIQGDTPEQRLDRQFAALNRLDPSNSAERAIIDQRIVRLAVGLDPNSLRGDQREQIARAAERQAEREERRFQEALDVQQKQLAMLERIAGVTSDLNDVARREGLAGVENALNITVRDETSDGAEVRAQPRRASARSTQILYEEQFR